MTSASGVPVTMTKNKAALVVFIAAVALCVSALPAGAQSLADVARKEAARRQSVKAPAKVITNDNLKVVAPAAPPATPADPAAQAPPAGDSAGRRGSREAARGAGPRQGPGILAQAHG